jgi:hypothetical protein
MVLSMVMMMMQVGRAGARVPDDVDGRQRPPER